jgi:hypothetical protein
LKYRDGASKLPASAASGNKDMASEPKRPNGHDKPNGQDNIVSLREARARQAAQARAEKSRSAGHQPEKKMPVLLIFLGLLAVVVALKMLLG